MQSPDVSRLGDVKRAGGAKKWLVADDDNVPYVNRNERNANVNYNWASNTWNNTALPRYRDCSIHNPPKLGGLFN